MDRTIDLIDSEAARLSDASEPSASGAWSDWLGMAASIGCAIHCAAMPFVIAYLPALGLSFLADEAFHKWMAVGCFIIAVAAFIPGFRKHGRLTPVLVASAGLVMISVAAFGLAGECCPSCATDGTTVAATDVSGCTDAGCALCRNGIDGPAPTGASASSAGLADSSQPVSPWISWFGPWLTPIGGLTLVSAHLMNRRYGCLCGCCGNEPSDGGVG